MAYSHDMSGSQGRRVTLPAGWRRFKITNCVEQTSKSGNPMFKFTLLDCETRQEEDVYAISNPGKRWFLKAILAACGVEAAQDGIYSWDIPDVMNQYVQGFVEHVDEEWIDRNGVARKTTKGKIVDVKNDDGSGAPDIPEEDETTPF